MEAALVLLRMLAVLPDARRSAWLKACRQPWMARAAGCCGQCLLLSTHHSSAGGLQPSMVLAVLLYSQVAKVDELSKLHKERRKHQLALQTGRPEKRRSGKDRDGKRKRRKGSGSDSGSGSSGSESSGSGSGSSDSGSGSESESEEERGRRKGGKRRRSRSRSKERSGKRGRSRSRSKERSGKRGRKEKRSSKDKKRGSKEKKKKREREKKAKKERREKDKAKAKVGAGRLLGCRGDWLGGRDELDLRNRQLLARRVAGKRGVAGDACPGCLPACCLHAQRPGQHTQHGLLLPNTWPPGLGCTPSTGVPSTCRAAAGQHHWPSAKHHGSLAPSLPCAAAPPTRADGRHWAGVRQVRHHPGDGHVLQAPRVPAVGHRGALLLLWGFCSCSWGHLSAC